MTTAGALAEKPAAKRTVFFEKKVQVSQYEPETASCMVEYFVDPEDNEATIGEKKRDALFECKSTVYDQLGVEYEIQAGTAVALVKDAFPGTTVVSEHPVTAGVTVDVPAGHVPPSADVDVPATPPHDPKPLAKKRSEMSELEKAMAKENQAWAEARFRKHPGEFFDNTEAKNAPNGNKNWPDFKHKDSGIGFYVS